MYMWVSIIIISLVGTFLHFLYDISGHNKFVAIFAAVNESTWEHVKIAFIPTLFWGIIDGFIYGENLNYFPAKFISLFIIVILIPLLFYGYRCIFKRDLFILNIFIFYIVIIVSQYVFYIILNIDTLSFIFRYLSCIGIFILFLGYMIHTLIPADSFIFEDPISNK